MSLTDRQKQYLSAMDISLWEKKYASADVEEVTIEEAAIEEVLVVEEPSIVERRSENPLIEYPAKVESTVDTETPNTSYTVFDYSSSTWSELQKAVRYCRACELSKTRTQTVFGVGSQSADVLVIGEAPGADEDRQGEPFVGRAGQLLNEMLFSIGFAREQVYIANILKCRPPNNRDPKPEEMIKCFGFLQRQIDLVQPKMILAVGRISAQHLLKTETPIGRLRGTVHRYGIDRIPLIVTYHPAYLLRSPLEKRRAWDDLLLVKHTLQTFS